MRRLRPSPPLPRDKEAAKLREIQMLEAGENVPITLGMAPPAKPTLKPGKTPRRVEKMLELSNSDDRPFQRGFVARGRLGTDLGLFSRLPLFQLMAALFDANERLPPGKRKTDTAITEIILADFPDRLPLHQKFQQKGYLLNYYRDIFNKGRMTQGRPPEFISFRYNSKGQKVDNRTGRIPLTPAQIESKIAKYRGVLGGQETKLPESGG